MGAKVFVTGGTGYLGGCLLQSLVAGGYQVRALLRRESHLRPHPQIETVVGDLSDCGRLASQMRGCDAVFHVAALVAGWVPDESEFYRVNVAGLRNVLTACENAGVGKLVYTSSFFALGPASLPGANELAPLEGRKIHPYQHSKLEARREAVRALAAGFPIVVLYPGIIYGPGKRTPGNLVATLIEEFARGRTPGLLGSGSQVWSYAFIDDIARGHLLALSMSPKGGEYVLGGENVSLRGFFAVLAALTGKRAPRLRIPLAAGMAAGGLQVLMDRLRGRVPSMTPSSIRMMYESWACDSTRAEADLGYRSRPLREGLIETLRDMRISVRCE
jgi:NAD+-dependent farnesol dehydrogenase